MWAMPGRKGVFFWERFPRASKNKLAKACLGPSQNSLKRFELLYTIDLQIFLHFGSELDDERRDMMLGESRAIAQTLGLLNLSINPSNPIHQFPRKFSFPTSCSLNKTRQTYNCAHLTIFDTIFRIKKQEQNVLGRSASFMYGVIHILWRREKKN